MKYKTVLNTIKITKMSSQIECPICMEVVEITRNCVTTECGHCFHANCLMTSVAHNGFGCPYCRTAMAEVPKEEEEEDEDDWTETSEDEEMFEEYALRGFRFLFNNLDGIEHDEADIEDENEDEQEVVDDDESKPSPAFIAEKLIAQGVTMEQVIKSLLRDHQEYEAHEDEFERNDDELFGKLRIIISNYTPEQAIPAPPQVVAPQVIAPQVVVEIDSSAQPKTSSILAPRRLMMHV